MFEPEFIREFIVVEILAVTKLPAIPTPRVPPSVLENCCEAVAMPKSEAAKLSCTISRVDMDTNPIPFPIIPKTIKHVARDVEVENVSMIPPPTTKHKEPNTAEGFFPKRLTIWPHNNAPTDQPRLSDSIAIAICIGVLPKAP